MDYEVIKATSQFKKGQTIFKDKNGSHYHYFNEHGDKIHLNFRVVAGCPTFKKCK